MYLKVKATRFNDGLDVKWREREQLRMSLHIWTEQLIKWSCLYRVRKVLKRKSLSVGEGRRETKSSALDNLGLRYLFYIY